MSEPCGRGICSAEKGHEGSCAEASGWSEVPADEHTPSWSRNLDRGAAWCVACGGTWPCKTKRTADAERRGAVTALRDAAKDWDSRTEWARPATFLRTRADAIEKGADW